MLSKQEKSERMMEVYEACYYYSVLYHQGQFSRAYRLGYTVERHYKPSILGAIKYQDLTPRGAELVNYLIEINY